MTDFFQSARKLKPFFERFYGIVLFVCKILLIGDIVITVWAVTGRYVPFITDPHWSEEMVLTMMVYMAVLSAALAIRRNAHIRLSAFDQMVPAKLIRISDLLSDIGVLVLGALLLIYGVKLCTSPLAQLGRYASLPSLSKFWQYLAIPVSGAVMIIFEVEQVLLHLEKLMTEDKQDVSGC